MQQDRCVLVVVALGRCEARLERGDHFVVTVRFQQVSRKLDQHTAREAVAGNNPVPVGGRHVGEHIRPQCIRRERGNRRQCQATQLEFDTGAARTDIVTSGRVHGRRLDPGRIQRQAVPDGPRPGERERARECWIAVDGRIERRVGGQMVEHPDQEIRRIVAAHGDPDRVGNQARELQQPGTVVWPVHG